MSAFKRGGAVLLTVLTALLLSLSMATAASAHNSADNTATEAACTFGAIQDADYDTDGVHDSDLLHDDDDGVACNVIGHNTAHPGTGTVDSVDNDSPADAVNVIRDYGLENAPIIIGVIGAIFLVGLTFYLVRRGLMKARGAMRL